MSGSIREEEFPRDADVERKAFTPTFRGGGTAEIVTSLVPVITDRPRGILHRVPAHVREKNQHIYEPVVSSLGPYHHGQPQLRGFEEVKAQVLGIMLSKRGVLEKFNLFTLKNIVERMDEIRSFYGGLSRDECSNQELKEMMVKDAFFLLFFMEVAIGDPLRAVEAVQLIGMLEFQLVLRDCLKLENQLPWWLMKEVISLTYDDEGGAFICRFLSNLFGDKKNRLQRIPWKEGTIEEPIHLLDAMRNTFCSINKEIDSNTTGVEKGHSLCPKFEFNGWKRRESSEIESTLYDLLKRQFFSATELKAKGIYLKPSSEFLNDLRFSSYAFYGELHLPLLGIGGEAITFFSNIIALELSPGATITKDNLTVTSYVNFMKSLIETPRDAKMLQENGILSCPTDDSEQIVRIFKEIDTHGVVIDVEVYQDIRMRIHEHCRSKAKTWIAELINTYFRTPWTAIALFAATFLLCLTLLQTYYAINPRNSGQNKD